MSPAFTTPPPFGWAHHVSEMAEFIAALALGPVHLVGHSRGGCVAYQLARRHPEHVRSLVLADPGGPLQLTPGQQASLGTATNVLRAKVAELIEKGDVEAGLELFVDSVTLPGAWKMSTHVFRRMATENASTLPKQMADPLPAYSQASAGDIACPTLLIDGQKSPRMFRNNVEKLQEWLRDAERVTIAGASHGMNVANPAAFNRAVAAFVSAHAKRAPLA